MQAVACNGARTELNLLMNVHLIDLSHDKTVDAKDQLKINFILHGKVLLKVCNFRSVQYTLLVLIDLCPVWSELLVWSSNYYRISDLGLTFPHFDFMSLYLDIFDQNLHFVCKNLQF